MRLSSVSGSWASGKKKASYILETIPVVSRGVRGSKAVLTHMGGSISSICKAGDPYGHSNVLRQEEPLL